MSRLRLGDTLVLIESLKATYEMAAPVAGVVGEVNRQLSSRPELINSDPYGAGRLVRLEITDVDLQMLTVQEYIEFCCE